MSACSPSSLRARISLRARRARRLFLTTHLATDQTRSRASLGHGKHACSGLLLACCLAFCFVLGMTSPTLAQPDKNRTPLSWDHSIRRIIEKHCSDCHNAEETSGNINLAQDKDVRMILQNRETWQSVLGMVKSQEMPPDDGPFLNDERRVLIVEFLESTLESLDCDSLRDPGKTVLRRLNRTEYDNAIFDLVGLDLKLAEGFAPDESSYGFDNVGATLSMSPVQAEQYHSAARTIVSELIDHKQRRPELYESIFGSRSKNRVDPSVVARKSMKELASRAFRRPVDDSYLRRLMDIYRLSRSKGDSYETALGHMITAILISPRFLMRLENNRPESEDPYPVDDYELATRLSFFLWSRPPDQELIDEASRGKLSEPENLEAQTRRMLADERSRALVKNFFGQWLSIRQIESHQPDSDRFPTFDTSLRTSMMDEIETFLEEMIRNDHPITDILDADYAYLNERLARHYKIKGIQGKRIRRVSLDDRRRGGLLTSAALLMAQSDPSRTNVPRRGNFIAGRILGSPPPPPPPDVPELEEIASNQKPRPLREMLELHRKNPKCANCHAKMDPFGFALENYDAIGRWRTKDGQFPIDTSGKLPSGEAIVGAVELKDYLLKQKPAFTRTLVKNLLIYALGRGLQGNDECVIRSALEAAEQNEDRFSAIVVEIVKSVPFRYRQNPID